METSDFLTIFAVVIMVLIYFAGVQRRKRRDRDKRLHDLKEKMVDKYVADARKFIILGVPSLARLGLERLESDRRIREAIEEMSVGSGKDVWGKYEKQIEDVDLVEFFKYVREHNITFNKTSVEEVVETVRKLK